MANRVYPRRGQVYTTEEILNTLDLRDSPSLLFIYNGRLSVIQTSHLTDKELLSNPELASLEWTYIRETIEWIPVFHAVDDDAVNRQVDIEQSTHEFDDSWWVTPKGFHREQYYGNGTKVN